MPPKKVVQGAKVGTKSTASPAKSSSVATKTAGQMKKPVAKTAPSKAKNVAPSTKGSPKKAANKGAANKNTKSADSAKKSKVLSKEEQAAVKLQSHFRKLLARGKVEKRKKEKLDYEELIEKLQREAWLAVVKRERDEAEKERLKEEEERRRKKEEAKRKKILLEAAFDGDKATIDNILNEVRKSDAENARLSGPPLTLHIARHQNALINCEDANKNSLVSESAAGGSGETIKYLIDKNANVNTRGAFNRTPLYRAAFGGHIQAVQVLLENGADPRHFADDGNKPEQIAALPEIKNILTNWNIEETERLLQGIKQREEHRLQTEKEQFEMQAKILTDEIAEAEKAFKINQKKLRKAYEELNKRIEEHDKCVHAGDVKTDITLQAVHEAEQELADLQISEQKARETLSELRLRLREETSSHRDASNDAAFPDKCVKCNIKELDDVLLRDVGDRIKNDPRWPLIVDASGQASVFLRYRDTNYLNALNVKDMDPDVLRKALLGALRYGKYFVIDMMEVDMLENIERRINEIEKDLYHAILSKQILQNESYLSLVKKSDGDEYSKEKFNQSRLDNFKFLLITKMFNPPEQWLEMFYAIKVIVS
eukprot:gene4654-5262_t